MRYIVVVQIATVVGASQFTFGNESLLAQAKKIVGIEAYSAAEIPVSPTAQPVLNGNAFKNAFLTLQSGDGGNKEHFQTYPLRSLNPAMNNGVIRKLDIEPINPPGSKVVFGTPANVANGEVVFLIFHCEK